MRLLLPELFRAPVEVVAWQRAAEVCARIRWWVVGNPAKRPWL